MADDVTLKPLPPEEAVEYLRGKGFAITFAWQEMWQAAHAQAFTVAKAMRLDILQDIRSAVDRALADGATFDQFLDELEPTLRAKGWWGKKEMVDPDTGEVVKAWQGTPWRLRTIFNQNLQTSYAAGRYKQMKDVAEDRPYWMYDAVLDERTRPEHASWDGTVLPHDHVWWETHYPPNGWNCRCSVTTLSADELEREGLAVAGDPEVRYTEYKDPKTGEVRQVPQGIDPGWGYNPGKAAWEPDPGRWDDDLQDLWRE